MSVGCLISLPEHNTTVAPIMTLIKARGSSVAVRRRIILEDAKSVE